MVYLKFIYLHVHRDHTLIFFCILADDNSLRSLQKFFFRHFKSKHLRMSFWYCSYQAEEEQGVVAETSGSSEGGEGMCNPWGGGHRYVGFTGHSAVQLSKLKFSFPLSGAFFKHSIVLGVCSISKKYAMFYIIGFCAFSTCISWLSHVMVLCCFIF